MRSTYNNFLLDGMDNNSYGTSNQNYSSQVVQPSPDALAEFRVITSNFSAEYGRVGGGVVNAALRSGTNQFHGTAYEFLRNTDLNAIGYHLRPRPALSKTHPPSQSVRRHHRRADHQEQTVLLRRLRRFPANAGLSQLLLRSGCRRSNGILPVTVINPLTGAVYPANTQIPVSQINPFAAAALAGLRRAQRTRAAANNLEETIPLRDYSDKYDAKLDYQINSKMTSFLRFSQRKDIQYFGPADPGPSGGDGNGFIHAIQQQAAVGYTWTVTPTSLFEARFGFDHVLGGKVPPYLGGPDIAASLRHPGPAPRSLAGGFPTQVDRRIQQSDSAGSPPTRSSRIPTSFNPKLNYSMVKGRHSLKVGYEFLAIRTEVLDINPLYGQTPTAASSASPRRRSAAARRPSPPTRPATISPTSISVFPAPSQLGTTS